MKFCRVCSSAEIAPLWKDFGGDQWWRCGGCNSDSSDSTFQASQYDQRYLSESLTMTGGMEAAKEQVRSNCSWFDNYAGKPGRAFLDVGHLEGAALAVMQQGNWSVHGFDINPAAAVPGCTTIAPFFAAHFFPQRYDAILCKDVLEHVSGWRQLLVEMTAALNRDGLLQLQTPTPWHEPHGIPYQAAHLQLFSPKALESAVCRLGYTVLDRRFWDMGQALLLRLTDKPFE